MALGASLSFAAARAGILGGLLTVDMIFARFIVAGLIMLPLLLRFGVRDLAGVGWRRALFLTLLGGGPFALLQTGGYGFAPLAHGAVIARRPVSARTAEPRASGRRGHRAGRHCAGRMGWAAAARRRAGLAGRPAVLRLERAVGGLHPVAAPLARAGVARHGRGVGAVVRGGDATYLVWAVPAGACAPSIGRSSAEFLRLDYYSDAGRTLIARAACVLALLSLVFVVASLLMARLSPWKHPPRPGTAALPPDAMFTATSGVFASSAVLASLFLMLVAALQLGWAMLKPSARQLRLNAARFALYGVGALVLAVAHITLLRLGPGLLNQ
ncbi:MAG: hypothetical protein GEV13_12225 [Rhodospirillales bacterium]|nr:hypothetical protein [Rhodospirillales bacterium]